MAKPSAPTNAVEALNIWKNEESRLHGREHGEAGGPLNMHDLLACRVIMTHCKKNKP